MIKTIRGNTYSADHVLVTIPLGSFKRKIYYAFQTSFTRSENQDNKGLFLFLQVLKRRIQLCKNAKKLFQGFGY